jgi:predicted lipoprotein with Yx(FWY)xxD motif
MAHRKPSTLFACLAALPLAALALAACGGGGSNASSSPPKTAAGSSATVGVSNVGLGKVLVNRQGRTVYLFTKDQGGKSSCTGSCTGNWPPVRSNGKPTLSAGTKASLVGTTARSDGKPQVTYNGHPLYLFSGDSKPGDTNGEGINAFGGNWYAVSPAGDQITAPPASSGGGSGY